ncbi:MAG: type II toxin-antitoxin system HicB family antitoxin [bacterium]|nr:type II toxin-antitoxin system HicB family antitoxin [bacterium]
MNYKFTTIINKEGKWYNAKCAELGVVSQGKTIEEAQKNLIEATELFLENEPSLPPPTWQVAEAHLEIESPSGH